MKELNLDKSKKYLLACSFGPDSMALFHALKSQGYYFECAIVNYYIREESTSEVNGLLEYANKNNIKVHVHECERNNKNKSEAKCREIRYDFFSRLYKENKYDALLVAHHEDDLLETYLMQKRRQNCPNYFGISQKTVIKGMMVIRPLLSFNKKELEEYCIKNHVPFAIDKTNFDTSILRNKIRHEVIAKMSNEDRKNLLKEIDIKNDELSNILSSIDLKKINSVSYLTLLDEISLKYALNILVRKVKESYYLSKENVGEIKKALLSCKPNITFDVKRGILFVKAYDNVELIRSVEYDTSYFYSLVGPGKLDTPFFYLDFSENSSNRNVKIEDYPIVIRNALGSDEVYIKGYKVSVRRLFIDWKMPFKLRKRWPIIVDKNGTPLYIPRYQIDFTPTSDSNFYVKY